MASPAAIIPVRDCPHRLPFKCAACVCNGESKLSSGAVDGADSTESSGKTRVNGDGHVEPAARQGSFAPASLARDKVAGSGQDGGSGRGGFSTHIPVVSATGCFGRSGYR